MESKKLEFLRKLKTNLIQFLDQLIEVYPSEPDFIMARVFINDQLPIESIMIYIIDSLLPLYDYVKKRDDRFFLEHNVLFSKIDNSKINRFSVLWKSEETDNHTKDAIWQWFLTILDIAKKYAECR